MLTASTSTLEGDTLVNEVASCFESITEVAAEAQGAKSKERRHDDFGGKKM